MGIPKVFEPLRLKYYRPNMFNELLKYTSDCITCQMRSARKIQPPIQETNIPSYSFAKIGLDLSGPYPTSLSGNKYIAEFIDLYSGSPEAFAVPNKNAENIAHLLLEEMLPRFAAPLQLLCDNAGDNLSQIMQETLNALKINQITTSFYHPQSNAKIERFHRTLHDILSKKMKDNVQTWDLYLNQALAAIRFNVSESSKFSPYSLIYNRDPVLPIDNILKPRRKYYGDQEHQIALKQQHKSFVLVHKYLKKAQKKQAKYANKNRKEVKLEVGDVVYHKNYHKHSKLNSNWKPFYRIIEKNDTSLKLEIN